MGAVLRRHRRTACVEAATQPRDGCAAAMRNWPGALGAPRPGCPRGRSTVCASASANLPRLPNRHRGSNGSTPRPAHAAGRRLSHRGGHRESEAQSLRSDPWAAVRRAGLDPMQPVPDSWDGNPPGFSARNAGKPETDSIIARTHDRMEGLRQRNRATRPKVLATLDSELASISNRGWSTGNPPRRSSSGLVLAATGALSISVAVTVHSPHLCPPAFCPLS